jgi:CBS domain-containing protein
MVDAEKDEDGYGMLASFSPTPPLDLDSQAAKRRRRAQAAGRVALIEPAACVMTDFASDSPVTVAVESLIDDALLLMTKAGVGALFAMRGELVVGLITSYDILGARVPQFLRRSGLTGRSEVEVGHVMTPWDAVPIIDVPWLALATVADVRERFQRKGASHFVVVEYADHGAALVRGIFSRAEVERRLGEKFER